MIQERIHVDKLRRNGGDGIQRGEFLGLVRGIAEQRRVFDGDADLLAHRDQQIDLLGREPLWLHRDTGQRPPGF